MAIELKKKKATKTCIESMHTRQTYRTSLSNLTVNLSILYLLCGNMVGYDTVRTQIS